MPQMTSVGLFRFGALALTITLSSCAVDHGRRNSQFIDCLQRKGGVVVSSGSQLAGVPLVDVQEGSGAYLDSIGFESLTVAVSAKKRQAIVFVGVPSDQPDPGPRAALRGLQATTDKLANTVLMRPSADPDVAIWDCQEEVAAGEATP
jgi:hypothetical protein